MADQVAAGVQPRRAWLERGHGIGDRLEHLVVHDDLARREPGHLGVVGGDQRDRLARVPHQVGGEHRLVGVLEPVGVLARNVIAGQDGIDAGRGQGLADRYRPDPGVRVRAAQRRAPDHVVHPQVAAVGELPGDLPPAVRPDRAGADAAGLGLAQPVAPGRNAGWRGCPPRPPGARVGVLTGRA